MIGSMEIKKGKINRKLKEKEKGMISSRGSGLQIWLEQRVFFLDDRPYMQHLQLINL
jgi:hypothetical protein